MSLIIQTVFANLIDWLFKPLDNLCSQLLTGAFSGLVGSMSNDEWNVAITAANRIGWIMGFVNMALCVIGALQAAAKGSVADVIKSFAMAVLAWPLTAVCISVMITMDGIVGQITHRILTVPLNGVGTSDPFGDSIVSNLIGTIVKTTGGYDLIIRCVVDFVLFLAVLALAGMLAARDISLILLACVAPLPVMMTGWKVTRPAAAKWAQAVVGVLLSAPLSALVIMVGSGICFVSKNNPNYAESFFPALMGIATIIMACFSPKLIMPAVSFIGENVTADMQERGGKIGPNAIKAAVQVTASVVQTATGGATGGLGKVVNSGAGAVLGAAQGNPAAVGSSIPGLASGIKDLLPKDGQAGGADGDYTSNGGVGDDARKPSPRRTSSRTARTIPVPARSWTPLPVQTTRLRSHHRRRMEWTVPVRARSWTPRRKRMGTRPVQAYPPSLPHRNPRRTFPFLTRQARREHPAFQALLDRPVARAVARTPKEAREARVRTVARAARARTADREAKAVPVAPVAREAPVAVAETAAWAARPAVRTRTRASTAPRPVRPSADAIRYRHAAVWP